jgi:YVTN family beta-propeller protein
VVEFRILGPLEVVEHDRPVVVGAPKVRALLAVLVLHRGEVVSIDRLIDALWGERASPTAARTVQVYVSNLRKALGDGLLVTRGRGYMLRVESGQVDADRFEALAARGGRALGEGDALTAAAVLREALGLWRGPALADFAYESFAQAEIARLEEARLAALDDRIDADLASGEQARLVGELEALVREHPSRERLQRQLMLALYRSGRQADALERYRQARRQLIDELGIEPGPALRELEQAILSQDPSLDAPGAGGIDAVRRVRAGGLLVAVAGAVLLAAVALIAVNLAGSGASSLQVAPNSLAAIDIHTNRVVRAVAVGVEPVAIAFGAGSLWVANVDDQTVMRIDPSSLRLIGTVSFGDPPTGLAASTNAIWVAESNPTGSTVSVTQIDPQFDEPVQTKTLGNVVAGGPLALAARGDTMWAAPSSGLLARIDAGTGRITGRWDPNAGPAAVAIADDGAVWVTDTDADNVTRVDPTGLLTQVPVGSGPTGIAVGDGAVWVADSLDDTVERISLATNSVTTTIPVGRSPSGVAFGAGSVWVANSGDGTVTRIDPASDKVVARIAVGGSPQAITVADGRAWVTVDAPTSTPPNVSSGGGTLRIEAQFWGNAMDPTLGLDPALATLPASWELLYATCAKLLNYPDKNGPAGTRLIPEVAQSLPVRSPDGQTYTFKIRSGFRFSPTSNQPVTAQTFKATIERTLAPAMHSYFDQYFGDIVGADAYMVGRAKHVTGVVASGDTLTIRLLRPVPDLPSRLALPGFCAVPPDTPKNPQVERVIPAAGPYYVSSYLPGREIVLTRNPNYRGSRPHRLARIDILAGVPDRRAVAGVEAGTADYAPLGLGSAKDGLLAAQLAASYGPSSSAAKRGHQQYFVSPQMGLDDFVLNTHRPLFSNPRTRLAASYATDRQALAQLGDFGGPLPDRPADHYLPPGIPGYQATHAYPLTPDLRKARALAPGRGQTAVLYTCNVYPCDKTAQILKDDLAAIGLGVVVKSFSVRTMFGRELTPGEPFDIGYFPFAADYPDPAGMLNPLLDNSAPYPAFADPTYQRRLADAARLSGPQRYLTYGKLDLDLARSAAPLIAYGNPQTADFFAARVGCQTFGVYGLDLAALCINHEGH